MGEWGSRTAACIAQHTPRAYYHTEVHGSYITKMCVRVAAQRNKIRTTDDLQATAHDSQLQALLEVPGGACTVMPTGQA